MTTRRPSDRDRIYWLLVVRGPLTMWDLRQETNWTTHRLAKVLYDLRRMDCARLIERARHRAPQGRPCGKWQAVQDDDNAYTHLRRYRQKAIADTMHSERTAEMLDVTKGCELCGDADGALFVRARCHMTAPLLARIEGEWLVLSCYLPTCGREVARLQLARSDPAAVTIGDRMRISVALIRQIAEEYDGTSPVVIITGIRVDDDGSKILVLQRPD